MAKATEILPLSGETFSLLIQATRGVSIILYEKPKAESARYRFLVFDDDGNSIIYRAAEGDSEILKHSTNTSNALGPDPQSRSVWVDFRSSNLVLGSGGEALMQWNDPSPISVSYVSVTADAINVTTITVLNRPYNSEFVYSWLVFCFCFICRCINLNHSASLTFYLLYLNFTSTLHSMFFFLLFLRLLSLTEDWKCDYLFES